MRIPHIIASLKELMKLAGASRQDALLCLGSVDFLLGFLLETAKTNGIHNMPGVRERIRDIQNYFFLKAKLINPEDAAPTPGDFARRALDTLTWQTLLGEIPELVHNNITREGMILHK